MPFVRITTPKGMQTKTRTTGALLAGTTILVIGMAVIEHFVWARCSGVEIHRYREIWMCWHFLDLWIVIACTAGLTAGLLNRKRGLIVGILVATAALAFYSIVYRYPFGTDYLAGLKHSFVFFMLPCAIGCVLGVRLTGTTWKYAL